MASIRNRSGKWQVRIYRTNEGQANSVRTMNQCGRPALRGKKVCQFHGGKSTGPKNLSAKEKLKTLNLKHGYFSQVSMNKFRKTAIKLRYLEDIAIHIGMIDVRMRGRKPTGYVKLNLNDESQYKKQS